MKKIIMEININNKNAFNLVVIIQSINNCQIIITNIENIRREKYLLFLLFAMHEEHLQ